MWYPSAVHAKMLIHFTREGAGKPGRQPAPLCVRSEIEVMAREVGHPERKEKGCVCR